MPQLERLQSHSALAARIDVQSEVVLQPVHTGRVTLARRDLISSSPVLLALERLELLQVH
jgi:hypothetical protein